MAKMEKEEILKIAKDLARKSVSKPYNVFGEMQMKENDHTKLLLSLLRYRDAYGQYAVLNNFLESVLAISRKRNILQKTMYGCST